MRRPLPLQSALELAKRKVEIRQQELKRRLAMLDQQTREVDRMQARLNAHREKVAVADDGSRRDGHRTAEELCREWAYVDRRREEEMHMLRLLEEARLRREIAADAVGTAKKRLADAHANCKVIDLRLQKENARIERKSEHHREIEAEETSRRYQG